MVRPSSIKLTKPVKQKNSQTAFHRNLFAKLALSHNKEFGVKHDDLVLSLKTSKGIFIFIICVVSVEF